ncbi:hypothetical protein ACQKRQ_06095 [Paraburkholderia sp. NPDC080076]|uniref:hypothetical protein n=1 Tax=Paraburkholderia sp. NPDC080076 TaxID=3390605 RepID=UPI003CFE799E
MLASPAMQFYDIRSPDGCWKDVDLNLVAPLFRVFVGNVILKNLVKSKIRDESIIAGGDLSDSLWIKPYTLTMDGHHYKGDRYSFPFLGGKLIDLGKRGDIGVTLAPVIREDLELPNDRELIEKYELTNMWGEDDLCDRLCRYFDCGINRDDLKFEIFPGLWNDREMLRPLTRRLPVPLR